MGKKRENWQKRNFFFGISDYPLTYQEKVWGRFRGISGPMVSPWKNFEKKNKAKNEGKNEEKEGKLLAKRNLI